MADGLLSSGLNWIDQQKQALKARFGLLADNPEEFARQMAAEARQRAGVGLIGEPKTAEEMASGAWINSPYGMQALQAGSGFAGTIVKNPQPFKVAHGTNSQFDEFKRGMGVTAKHIYTTPEQYAQDAVQYGKNLITAEATPKKMIDLSSYENLDKSTLSAIKSAAKNAGITDKYYTFNNFLDDLMNGQMYQVGGGQRIQNAFLDELFSKYDAVKMPDASVGGGLSQSIVFENPSLLKIQK